MAIDARETTTNRKESPWTVRRCRGLQTARAARRVGAGVRPTDPAARPRRSWDEHCTVGRSARAAALPASGAMPGRCCGSGIEGNIQGVGERGLQICRSGRPRSRCRRVCRQKTLGLPGRRSPDGFVRRCSSTPLTRPPAHLGRRPAALGARCITDGHPLHRTATGLPASAPIGFRGPGRNGVPPAAAAAVFQTPHLHPLDSDKSTTCSRHLECQV